jgi:hypothetical protein
MGKYLKRAKRGILLPSFDITDVGSAQSRVLGEIVLIPSLGFAKIPDPTTDSGTNITCHNFRINVFFWLYFAYWLHFPQG